METGLNWNEVTRHLTLEERGALAGVVALSVCGRVEDDDRMIAGAIGVRVDLWRRLRTSLVEKGILKIEENCELGTSWSPKTEENCESPTFPENCESPTFPENCEKSAVKTDPLYIHTTDTHIPTPSLSEASTTRATGFGGKVIRLTAAELAHWRTTFRHIPNLAPELYPRALWLAEQSADRKRNWHGSTAYYLKNKDAQHALAGKPQLEAEVPWHCARPGETQRQYRRRVVRELAKEPSYDGSAWIWDATREAPVRVPLDRLPR